MARLDLDKINIDDLRGIMELISKLSEELDEVETEIEKKQLEIEDLEEKQRKIKMEDYATVEEFTAAKDEILDKLKEATSSIKESVQYKNKLEDIADMINSTISADYSYLNGTVDELLNEYTDSIRKIEELNFKSANPLSGGLTREDKKELSVLKRKQEKIKEELKERFTLNAELKSKTDSELYTMKADSERQLTSVDPSDTELKEELEKKIKEIKSEIEFRKARGKVVNGLVNIVQDPSVTKENVMEIDIHTPSLGLDDSTKDKFILEKSKAKLLDDVSRDITGELSRDGGTGAPTPDGTTAPDPTAAPDPADVYTVTFKNGPKEIDGYTNLSVPKDTVIHGPVIDPVKLDKEGNTKKITAMTFAGWVDQDGNEVTMPGTISRDCTLSAKYEFDMQKATAIGLGALIGGAIFCLDFSIPIPVSAIGAVGFGGATVKQYKNLKNLQQSNETAAATITAFDTIPEDLKKEIDKAKDLSNTVTMLKTITAACTISTGAYAISALTTTNAAAAELAGASTLNGIEQVGMVR